MMCIVQFHPQTIFESMLVASCCVFVDKDILVSAFATTCIVVFGLVLYALFTKTDFTGCGPYLFCALFILIGIGILSAFRLFPVNIYAYLGVISFRPLHPRCLCSASTSSTMCRCVSEARSSAVSILLTITCMRL